MVSKCLICAAVFDERVPQGLKYNFPGCLNSSLLNEQLWSTFILTKIVELPSFKFESILKATTGIHPGNWFDLCNNCSENVTKIVEIQDKINQLQCKVDKFVKDIKDKFKTSLEDVDDLIEEKDEGDNKQVKEISREIRRFFKIIREPKTEVNDNNEFRHEGDDDCWNWEPLNDLGQNLDDDNLTSESEDWMKPITKRLNKNSLNRKRKRYPRVSEEDQNSCKSYYTPGAFQCTICPRKLKSQDLLDKHYRYHDHTQEKFNGKFDCTICKAPGARLFHLKNHYKNVHKLKLANNWDVNEVDNDNQVVKVDNATKSNAQNLKLDFNLDMETQSSDDDGGELTNDLDDSRVEKPRRKKQMIKKTINRPTNEAVSFKCPMCIRKYRSQAFLNKHLVYHQMTKTKYNGKFDCEKCGAPFARIMHLTQHYRNVHQSELNLEEFRDDHLLAEQSNFKCPKAECQFSCKKEAGLKYHLKVKHKMENDLRVPWTPTPLVCELCGFIAKESDYGKQQLQRHMLNHKIFDNSVNPSISTTELVCNLCNQLFKSRTDLRSHKVTIHASELGLTSYQCSYCPRQFPNKQNLFHHEQRIHKKKGRFPCPLCDHEAMNPYRLNQHMAKHTKERDICQYCSATYSKTGGQLRQHIKKHHPDKFTPSTSRLKYGGVPVENNELIEKKPKIRKIKCKYCFGDGEDEIVCDSQLAYTMHLEESHKDLYRFECDLCGNRDGSERKVYMSLTSLNYHKKIHHQEKGKGVRCGWCGAKVAHRLYLYGHLKNCKSRPVGQKGILAVEDYQNDNS